MTTTDSRTRSLIDVDVLEYHRLLTPEQQEELTEIRAALADDHADDTADDQADDREDQR